MSPNTLPDRPDPLEGVEPPPSFDPTVHAHERADHAMAQAQEAAQSLSGIVRREIAIFMERYKKLPEDKKPAALAAANADLMMRFYRKKGMPALRIEEQEGKLRLRVGTSPVDIQEMFSRTRLEETRAFAETIGTTMPQKEAAVRKRINNMLLGRSRLYRRHPFAPYPRYVINGPAENLAIVGISKGRALPSADAEAMLAEEPAVPETFETIQPTQQQMRIARRRYVYQHPRAMPNRLAGTRRGPYPVRAPYGAAGLRSWPGRTPPVRFGPIPHMRARPQIPAELRRPLPPAEAPPAR